MKNALTFCGRAFERLNLREAHFGAAAEGICVCSRYPRLRLSTSAALRQKSVFIRVHPWLKKKVEIAKRTQFPSQVAGVQKQLKGKFPNV
jgi:hypothetical protein